MGQNDDERGRAIGTGVHVKMAAETVKRREEFNRNGATTQRTRNAKEANT